ncbi:MAG: hypothetical protein LQ348_001384 [Seirophora lacunosa]|nr:MAG: hypothetical protein LQ348_001384 [Seirophora lacunosa]
MICLELHEKYGPVVRTGPDMVLVNDPDSLSIIFRWDRGGGLDAFFKLSKISNLLADAEMKGHDKMKRAFKQPVKYSPPLLRRGLIEKGCDFEKMVYGIERGASLSLIPLILSWTPNALAWMGFSAIAPLLFRSVKSISFMTELAEKAVDDAVERKSGKVRQDIVQSLVDYRDHDGKPIPKERLYGDVYGLMRAPQASPLPRVVPKGGAEICGYYLPEGTNVGILPWSFLARTDLFGTDVRAFRPERWLEDSKHQTRILQKSLATFGGGSTYCAGKNVADVEMTKFLVQLFREYTVVVQDPVNPIKRTSCLTINYSDLKVSLVARNRGQRCREHG